jgi:hypothetical protein
MTERQIPVKARKGMGLIKVTNYSLKSWFMKFDKDVEKKNPMAYFIVSFFLGLVIGFIGWQMNESTKMSTANVGVWVKWIGIILIVGGVIGMFAYKKKAKR